MSEREKERKMSFNSGLFLIAAAMLSLFPLLSLTLSIRNVHFTQFWQLLVPKKRFFPLSLPRSPFFLAFPQFHCATMQKGILFPATDADTAWMLLLQSISDSKCSSECIYESLMANHVSLRQTICGLHGTTSFTTPKKPMNTR